MDYKTYNPVKAVGFALFLWILGFVWGTVVFMTPQLMAFEEITYISQFPAISFPLIIVYAILTIYFSRNYLKPMQSRVYAGYKLGFTLFLVNIVLDGLIYALVFGTREFFSYLSVWLAYVLIMVIPWGVAVRMEGHK
ncbi:hypothetical protein J2755_000965 [Methanohalophilus levihalophilus]|uniref:hypothetical protein n=1 Tax=Methanohalophilus levihalophilus TaxID=1431282 RepID=UPI001AE8C210|nr:hypothetical protein [Methanohalophilus levihalophilus]MBP2030031.1 hypothetical protein [Methanohalophilus levihalophilus]